MIDKQYLSGVGHVFRVPARALVDGADVVMQEVASFTLEPDVATTNPGASRFPGTIITSADISPDGGTILVRTYRRVLAFSRGPRGTVASAFRRPPCEAPQLDERQGEAVGFAANGASYFTISEGVGAEVHRFASAPAAAGLKCDGTPRTGGCAAATTSLESHREQQQRQQHSLSVM